MYWCNFQNIPYIFYNILQLDIRDIEHSNNARNSHWWMNRTTQQMICDPSKMENCQALLPHLNLEGRLYYRKHVLSLVSITKNVIDCTFLHNCSMKVICIWSCTCKCFVDSGSCFVSIGIDDRSLNQSCNFYSNIDIVAVNNTLFLRAVMYGWHLHFPLFSAQRPSLKTN